MHTEPRVHPFIDDGCHSTQTPVINTDAKASNPLTDHRIDKGSLEEQDIARTNETAAT